MKDSYWFRHDSNARNDEKIIDLRAELGYEGYGIYWALIEYLRDTENYEAELKPKRIAYAIQAEEGLIEQVINGYGLFVVDKEKFYSNSLKERMKEMDRKREQQRQNANKRWAKGRENDEKKDTSTEVYHGNATALPEKCHKIREDKSKEEKKRGEDRRDSKEREGGIYLPGWLPEPGMMDHLLNVHSIKDPRLFVCAFFHTIGTLYPFEWSNEAELKNKVVNRFGLLFSEGIEKVNPWDTCLYIGIYGFGLSIQSSKKELQKLKEKDVTDEKALECFIGHVNKTEKPTRMLTNISNYLERKNQQNTDTCN